MRSSLAMLHCLCSNFLTLIIIILINFRLAPAIGTLYMQNFPRDENSKEIVMNLVKKIKSSLIDMLNNATWMDENTKRSAMDKAKSTTAHIGFPKELSNRTKIEEHYQSLGLNESEFFMNVLRLKRFNQDYNFRQLHKPVDEDKWLRHTMLAPFGASYIKQSNEMCKFEIQQNEYYTR